MESELLSLKWNNHRTTFLHVIGTLRSKASYTDATLACDGKFYPVHKLVLSTCSEYFGAIFERTPCKSPVIVLKDIECKNLEFLLDYMYIGEVNVRQNELAALIKAAECLKIKGLAVPDEEPSV
ncbi:Longitudinals lacking protein-like [Armadillidium nasatum]|uniref:Longitudinals lacking protein-like n=1 Tax=Armadillidium nasatum TaxID=96803 RepID=A0A5N5TF57_9CRUS|nr:Longitudinals lacking protein-like [Armadillidium nasatum]